MSWVPLYIFIAISTIIVTRMAKKGEVFAVSYIFAIISTISFTIILAKILTLTGLLIAKLMTFLFFKFKALVAKKIILIIAGLVGGSLVPVIQFIVWIAIGIFFIYSIKGFYSYIFSKLREFLYEIRSFFDEIYDKLIDGRNAQKSAVLLVALCEATVVSGPNGIAVWIAISAYQQGVSMTPIQQVFAFLLCVTVTILMYFQYRSDTRIFHALKGDGVDYNPPPT